MDYRSGYINWELFVRGYKREMKNRKILIKILKERSKNGEVITLLCWEREDVNCHRRILKELIEEDITFKVRITYYGSNKTIYSELEEYNEETVIHGMWESPFDRNSPAIGLYERLIQSDRCPPVFTSDEKIIRIKAVIVQ